MFNSIFENTGSVKAGFQKLFANAIEEIVEDDCRKRFVLWSTPPQNSFPETRLCSMFLCENKSNLEALFARFIQNGIDSGELPKSLDAESTALMLFTISNGLRVVAKVDPNPVKLKKMVDAALSVLDGQGH